MAEHAVIKIDFEALSSSGIDEVICNFSIKFDSASAQLQLHLDRRKYLQASLFEFGTCGICYEPDYSSILLKVLRPGDTFIDIGANFGYFSLLASSLVTCSGRVISLEPECDNFRFLSRNIDLNEMKNIHAFNIAAGEINKEAKLFIDPLNDGGHSLCGISPETLQQIGNAEISTSRTYMVTLDSLLNSEKITAVKIIKIDTEGWEFNIINGSISAIKKFCPPIIIAEINRFGLRRAGASERYLRLMMSELGYSTYVASCLANGRLVLHLLPDNYSVEPDLEHFNYNAVFARPGSLSAFSECYHVFN